MPIEAVLILALLAAIALLAVWHWETGEDDGEPPTLNTRNDED